MNKFAMISCLFSRLTPVVVLGAAFAMVAPAATAQFKTSPPQPGNGWVNSPSGNRVLSLRNQVSVEIRHETVPVALTRVVQGSAVASARGLDSVLTVLGPNRMAIQSTVQDGKTIELHLPGSLRNPMVIVYALGTPSFFSLGSPVLNFRADDLVRFANLTSIHKLDFQVLGFTQSTLFSMPVEVRIDPTKQAIRLEL
ncbi:MAG: hypothetical protein H6832_00825 [Planctomycetes bacterium]|nr:hypothetical protein [Planctomycetota bacterium]MCB9916927.1 hypothetical protein [Planctomycetota bacterium]